MYMSCIVMIMLCTNKKPVIIFTQCVFLILIESLVINMLVVVQIPVYISLLMTTHS